MKDVMFTADEICKAVNGKIVTGSECKCDGNEAVYGVSKDTRTINPGDLYIALIGENFDGHDFCKSASEKGAFVQLISDESKLPSNALGILTDNTAKALGLLAKYYRLKIGAKVVAVTGSVGKTSTREMIALGLSGNRKVFSTKANLNNDIGLPMTILEAPSDTEVLVLEMGMRARGEISYLTNIACPDIAVITNVGYCHIEILGSQEEILYAKNEIVEGLREGGVLAVNGDDKYLSDYSSTVVSSSSSFAAVSMSENFYNSKAKYSVNSENVRFEDGKSIFNVKIISDGKCSEIKDVTIPANGVQHVRNSLFAFLCGEALSCDLEKVKDKMNSYTEMKGRGKTLDTGKITVIDDAYNAAPESVSLALENLEITGRGKRKIAVLGGMLELGDYADMLHERVGMKAGETDLDAVFVIGDNKDAFVKGFKKVKPEGTIFEFDSKEELFASLDGFVRDNDCLLFKASHAFGFQEAADEYIKRWS